MNKTAITICCRFLLEKPSEEVLELISTHATETGLHQQNVRVLVRSERLKKRQLLFLASQTLLIVCSAHARPLRLHLPLPEEVSDGGVLCRQGAGEQWHQAPEALPQLLHVLLQAVDVRVQLPPAALHLRQDVVH